MRAMGKVKRGMCVWIALGALGLSQMALAQQPTGTILGVVKDSTGGVIPGASVTVTNTDTGMVRTGTTGADGSYRFPALPVGTYEIRVGQPGFQSEVRSGLKLNVGQEAVLNFALQVGAVEQTVAVTAEAPMIETTSATVSGLVSESTMRDLPLNARNLIELATLFPGVTVSREAGQGVPSGFATKLAIMGTRFNTSLFQMDGQDINDGTQSAGGAAGILMGVETIREFNVVTSGYSAEYGKHSGGVFNAVTKSGSNSLHGSVFEFLRNDKMDARNYFDRDPSNPTVRSDPPPFKRNQYGFAVGGPIVRDKTFFFGSYEALRERLGRTQTFNTPTLDTRKGLLPGRTIAVAPGVQPYLNAWPIPNGKDFGDGTAEHIRGFSFPTDEDFFSVRADHTFSDKDTLFGRFTFDDAEREIAAGWNTNTLNFTRTQYAALSETHLFSPEVINVFLMAYNRSLIGQDPVQIEGFVFPTRSFTTFTEPIGTISVPGLSGWGGSSIIPSKALLNGFQFKDDLFYTRGSHSLKFGFNAQRMQLHRKTLNWAGGVYAFSSLDEFLTGRVNNFQFLALGADPAVYPRQTLYGLYAQDDIRVSPRFTLNLGLRYEFVTQVNVLHDRVSNLHNYWTPNQTVDDLVYGNPMFKNPSLKNFAPRIGFAWDPFGTGKTSVRGGVGIFYDQLLAGPFIFSFVSAYPFSSSADVGRLAVPPFPDAFYKLADAGKPATPQSEPIQFRPEQPTVYKYSLDIQQAVTPSTSVEAGFAATRGVHLMRMTLANVRIAVEQNGRLFVAATSPFLHPGFGRIRPKISDATSDYFALRMGVNQRFTHGLMFRGSYTWSKTTDDGSSFAGGLDFNNDTGPLYLGMKQRGLSTFDIRHAFTLNFTYDLPGQNLTGAKGKVLGGWQASGILSLQTGTPFDVSSGAHPGHMLDIGDFPDLVTGATVRYDTRNPNRYFDPSAFKMPGAPDSNPNAANAGYIGNVGRDFMIGPGIANFSFVIAKAIPFTETVNLQIRSEFHNLFNRANFGRPSGAIFDARTRAIRPTAGRTTDALPSRQLQFGLKLVF